MPEGKFYVGAISVARYALLEHMQNKVLLNVFPALMDLQQMQQVLLREAIANVKLVVAKATDSAL